MPPFSRLENIGQLAIAAKVAVEKYCEIAGHGDCDEFGVWKSINPALEAQLEKDMSAAQDVLDKQIDLYLKNERS
jgi:hypothetical protein